MGTERDGPRRGRRRLRTGIALAVTLLLGLIPASAGATVVTIGTPTASFAVGQSSAGCNCTQYQATAPAGYVETAPAAGVITGWRVAGAGTLTLEVLRRAADGSLSIVGESTGGQSASTGTVSASQPVHIPVLAGDFIAVHLAGTSPKVYNSGPLAGGTIGEAAPDIPATFPNLQTPGGTLDLNADITLTPQIASVSPSSGPTGATNLVTISGQYLDGVTSVEFGGIPAAFTLVSPTEITAYGPLEGPGVVDVTVTGPAATSAVTAADQFDFLPKPGTGQTPIASGSGTPGAPGASFVLSPLSLSASYFLAAPSGASIAAATAKKTAVGTTLTYTVSAPATTSFVIQEGLPGRLLPATSAHAKRICIAPNEATLPQKLPACARYVSLTPKLTHTGPAGRNTVHLSGRLNGHALASGSYRLVATAMSSAMPTLTSAQVTHAFHILAPPKPAKPGAKPKAHAALPG
jgi:hypothetical protein